MGILRATSLILCSLAGPLLSGQDLASAQFGDLRFSFQRGGPLPVPQKVTFDSDDHRTVSLFPDSPPWMRAVVMNDPTPAILTISVDPAGLETGIYEGDVFFRIGSDLGTVHARLTVLDAPRFIAGSSSLTFLLPSGGTGPSPQTLYVTAANQPVAFTAKAVTSSCGSWLLVSPAQARTPANLEIRIDPAAIFLASKNSANPAGDCSGSIVLSAPAASNDQLSIPVRLTITPAGPPVPHFTAAGTLNLASRQPGPLAPGELILVNYSGTPVGDFLKTKFNSGQADTILGETRLLFDGTAAPLLSVALGNSIQAMVPFELDGKQSVQLQIEYQGRQSDPVTLQVVPAQPGIFTGDLSGKGIAVAGQINPGTPFPTGNGPGSGVQRGGVLFFYATGTGQLIPPGRTGSLRNGQGVVRLPVTVSLGGKNAEVLYAGAAPGLAEGISQFNIRVPADAPVGAAVSIMVSVGEARSQAGTTVTVSE